MKRAAPEKPKHVCGLRVNTGISGDGRVRLFCYHCGAVVDDGLRSPLLSDAEEARL